MKIDTQKISSGSSIKEVLGITCHLLRPSNSKMYEKVP